MFINFISECTQNSQQIVMDIPSIVLEPRNIIEEDVSPSKEQQTSESHFIEQPGPLKQPQLISQQKNYVNGLHGTDHRSQKSSDVTLNDDAGTGRDGLQTTTRPCHTLH